MIDYAELQAFKNQLLSIKNLLEKYENVGWKWIFDRSADRKVGSDILVGT